MNTPIELCHHLNYVRQNYTKGIIKTLNNIIKKQSSNIKYIFLGQVRRIPDVGYNMYKSQFEDVNISEGFTEIVNIDFKPVFEDEKHEILFKQRTNQKNLQLQLVINVILFIYLI